MEICRQYIPFIRSSIPLSEDKRHNKTCRNFRDRFYLFIILWLTGLSFVSAQDSLLVQHFTVPDTTCTVDVAMQLIENQTGLSFSYNTDIINKKKIITLHGGPNELIHILENTFNDPQLNFSIIGRHIVVYQTQRTLSANPEKPRDSVYFFEIRGRVLDKSDKQPLPYSSIYLSRQSNRHCNK